MKTVKKIITLATFFSAICTYAGEIDFKKGSWEEIKSQARNNDKLIFVDAYASWCGPCKTMTANTFTDNDVAGFYNEHFINYKLDMESEDGIAFNEQYSITAYPTLLFINGDGEVVKEVVGFKNAEDFLDLGKGILFPTQTKLYQLSELYKKGQRDTSLLYNYIFALNDAGEDTELAIEEYFSQINEEDLFKEKPFVLFYLHIDEMKNHFTKYFIDNYPKFEDEYGDYAVEKGLGILEVNAVEASINEDEELFKEVMAVTDLLFPDFADELKPEIESIYYYGVE